MMQIRFGLSAAGEWLAKKRVSRSNEAVMGFIPGSVFARMTEAIERLQARTLAALVIFDSWFEN